MIKFAKVQTRFGFSEADIRNIKMLHISCQYGQLRLAKYSNRYTLLSHVSTELRSSG